MSIINRTEILKLFVDTIKKHPEVDLKIVANLYVNHKIINDMIEVEGVCESDARRKGNALQPEVERVLIQEALKLSKSGAFDFDRKNMIIKRK